MRRIVPAVALGLWLALAAPRASRAQYVIGARDTLTARVDSVFRAFDRSDAPGCAVGVYRNGAILYARGYGMANLELGVPITPRTVFDIGSISKQFTATAVLLLARDGKLSLADDVRHFFPEMPAYASGVTVRNLLNHTSGVRDYFALMEDLGGRDFDGVADTVDYLRAITRSATTNFPVGTRYLYSNSGYALLGQLVYRVSGQSLPAYLREHVLGPLDMRETRSLDDHTAIIPNRAQGYAPGGGGGGFRIAMSQADGTGGAGSMHTTVEDFVKWDRNWDSATVGGRPLVDSLRVRGKLKNDSTISYALGVVVSTWRGLRRVSHDGAFEGYRAYYVRFPEQHLSVATFCNVANSGPDTLGIKVAAIYLGAQMGPDTVGSWDAALTAAPAVPMTAEQFRPFAGVWRNTELGIVQLVRITGDSLMIGDEARRRLVPIALNRFRVGRLNVEVTFEGDSAGAPNQMRVRTRGGSYVVRRVAPVSLTADQLAEYAGDYRSDEIETTWTLAPDSAGLVVRVNGRRLFVLLAAYRDGFSGENGNADFTRDTRGRITSLVVQAGRALDVPFTRLR